MADNLVLGRGKLFFEPYLLGQTTGGTKGYFGDTTDVTLAQNVTKLDHYSSEGGLKVKDRTVELQRDMTITFTCDNISTGNLTLWFGGSAGGTEPSDAPTDIGDLLLIGKANAIYGAMFFEEDNGVGTNVNYWFPYVNLTPNGNYALKGDAWQTMGFTAEVLKRDDDTERLYIYGEANGSSVAPTDASLEFTPMSAGVASGTIATGGSVTHSGGEVHEVPFNATFTLTGGNVAYASLHDGTAVAGAVHPISGASGTITGLTAPASGTYTIKLYANSARTGSVLATSSSITVT